MYTPTTLLILLMPLTTTTLAQMVGEIGDGQIQAPGPAAAPNMITPAPAPAPKVVPAPVPSPIAVAPKIISAPPFPPPLPAKSVPFISPPPHTASIPPPLSTGTAPLFEAAITAAFPSLNTSVTIPPYPTNPSLPRYTGVNTIPQPRLENVTAPTVPANPSPSFVDVGATGTGSEGRSEAATTAVEVSSKGVSGKRMVVEWTVVFGCVVAWGVCLGFALKG